MYILILSKLLSRQSLADQLVVHSCRRVFYVAAIFNINIQLAHQVVVTQLGKSYVSLCVVSEEHVLVLGICLDPLLIIRVRNEGLVSRSAEIT